MNPAKFAILLFVAAFLAAFIVWSLSVLEVPEHCEDQNGFVICAGL